jgi:hypothetical protein
MKHTGLADRIAITERKIDGTSVYLIRISYLEHDKNLDLRNNNGFKSSFPYRHRCIVLFFLMID